jgi:hypothetical protein
MPSSPGPISSATPRAIADAVGDVVVAEVGEVAPEGVGLHRVGTGLEVGAVDAREHLRPGDVEDLVAALEALEVVQGQVGGLQHRPHRPVADEDALAQRIEKRRVVRVGSGGDRHGAQGSSLRFGHRS